MNRGKLEVVRKEMAIVNTNILGISELKWTWTDKFNSDDHHIYYCGKESLRRNGVALTVNKESEMQYLDAISKMTEWALFISKQTIQYHSNPSLCPNQCQRSWRWMVQWRPTRPSRTNTKKRWHFHHSGLECKRRKSRDTWRNSQVWPWSSKWSRAKANSFAKRTHWS